MKIKKHPSTSTPDKPNLRITLKRKKLPPRSYLEKFTAEQIARLATLRPIGRPRGTVILQQHNEETFRMDGFKRPDTLELSGNVAEDWKKFKQQLEFFMIAIGYDTKPDKVKVATLLNLIGDDAVEVFNTFVFDEEEGRTYAKVVEKFDAYCNPRNNEIYSRWKFYSRVQAENEPFEHFLTDLRTLVKDCSTLEEDKMIRDRIIFGCHSTELRDKLITKDCTKDVTLNAAIEAARLDEVKRKQLKLINRGSSSNVRVDAVNRSATQRIGIPNRNIASGSRDNRSIKQCEYCLTIHAKGRCPAYGQQCRGCQKMHHYQ